MKLATNYLGLNLRNPLVVGASPLCDDIHLAKGLEEAGAAAIVMHSLFEEQVELEQRALTRDIETPADSNPEATSYFPRFDEYHLAPEQYLRQIECLKAALTIPVIASLNGCRSGGWTDYACRFESAGADAIELNVYQLATDPRLSAQDVETEMLKTVHDVTTAVKIPVAVKISPFHTAPARFARELELVGAAGVVVFNRFYQPDFNIEDLGVEPQLKLSDPSDLLLRLRWLAIMSPHVKGSLAATGGVHSSDDMIKSILAGAHAVQVVSVLLKHGPRVLTTLLGGLRHWMGEHHYENLDQFRGALNLGHCPDPAAFERGNYQKILQSWRV
ncbi:MAG: dihydroorotate dehydrogenase-like protein [Opitutaceae bacterium]|jgi:dihydroorotate dehydrogenase (fumarate)